MYVYIRSEPGLWTVGFYSPHGEWHSESDHDSREAAADRVHWLNGGNAPRKLENHPDYCHEHGGHLRGSPACDQLRAANEQIAALRKARDDDQREFQREARDIAAEARWAERQGDEYGSY